MVRPLLRLVLILGLVALPPACVRAGIVNGVVDLDGNPVDPLAASTARAVVLVFVAVDCPISNRLAPELRRIHDHYSPRGVSFYLIYPEPDLSIPEVRDHATAYDYPFPALLDPGHHLVEETGATVTPEAVVLSPRGEVLYRGRVNNRFVDFGKTRARATRHDLRQALDAVLAGRPVAQAETRAVGCFIPPLD